ncbi:MAG: DUF1080 domain-containing protein [Bryobacteraceae bacterium]|nr:DUF1080 domain-containing protein [Bryobacteraceae bacterium]
MPTRRAFLAAAVAAAAAHAQRTGDMRDPDLRYDEAWTSLFNGKDLGRMVVVLKGEDGRARKYFEDRINEQQTFSARDGLLVTTGTPEGYIRTTDVYDNFAFHVEVRYPSRGNSGVLIHIQQDAVWPRAIECQLYQSHMGRIFPIHGAYLEGGEMIHEASKPVGEWNTFEVYSEEGRVATVLNGVLVGLAAEAEPRIGHVALQAEGVAAEFRNIRIRRHAPSHHLWPKPPREKR